MAFTIYIYIAVPYVCFVVSNSQLNNRAFVFFSEFLKSLKSLFLSLEEEEEEEDI